MAEPIVIGIDGGGTTTRAAAADLHGNILATAETGGSNPQHAPDAEQNVREAIRLAIEQAGRKTADVVSLVAGMAGLDEPADAQWAERATALSGLACPRLQVNDSVVAHAGSLLGEPGIIAIGGTGSIVFGVTECGRHVRNYDFANYAPSASRFLAYETLFRIVAGDSGTEDAALVEATIRHWGVQDLQELRHLASRFSEQDRQTRNYRAGEMGPAVTAAAMSGSPLAQRVCEEAAYQTAIAIRVVATAFESDVVPVAFIGSALRSLYLSSAIIQVLARCTSPQFQVRDPVLAAVAGALLMALEQAGVVRDAAIIQRLHAASAMDSRPAR